MTNEQRLAAFDTFVSKLPKNGSLAATCDLFRAAVDEGHAANVEKLARCLPNVCSQAAMKPSDAERLMLETLSVWVGVLHAQERTELHAIEVQIFKLFIAASMRRLNLSHSQPSEGQRTA